MDDSLNTQSEKSLWGQLSELSEDSNSQFGKQSFIPAGVYQKILNKASVRNELQLPDSRPVTSGQTSCQADDDDKLIEFVLERAPKVFLIFLGVFFCAREKVPQIMRHVQRIDFTDKDLPVDGKAKKGKLVQLETEPGFPKGIWHNFCQLQWEHLAPVFNPSHERFSLPLTSKHPLPFFQEQKGRSEGYTSIVYRVQVHQDHLIDPSGEIPSVTTQGRKDIAIKEFRRDVQSHQDFAAQFEKEAEALEAIRDLNHNHIIRWIAAFTHGPEKHYLMFPWADGGNLRQFWSKVDPVSMDMSSISRLVEDTLVQFTGIADALFYLHVERQYRHGDIKPENILRFTDPSDSERTGTLKVADFGLAKQHDHPTALRHGPTTTCHTTLQYESPEADDAMTEDGNPLSRLTDIWSLGCVMLEHVIWMVYGKEAGLEEFNEQLKKRDDRDGIHRHTAPFYTRTTRKKTAEVRQTVKNWIASLKSHEGLHGTVISSLVDLIDSNLLVTEPRRWDDGSNGIDIKVNGIPPSTLDKGVRATAEELYQCLKSIIDDAQATPQRLSWFPERQYQLSHKRRRLDESGTMRYRPEFVPKTTRPDKKATTLSLPKPDPKKPTTHPKPQRDYLERMARNWNVVTDMQVLPDRQTNYPEVLPASSNVCSDCSGLNFGATNFQIDYAFRDMEIRASSCSLCRLLLKAAVNQIGSKAAESRKRVKFMRSHSSLVIQDYDYEPVLSLIASPELHTISPLQIGFPNLPAAGSEEHFRILRYWLTSCDESHQKCKKSQRSYMTTRTLPTRLLDVGHSSMSKIFLVETKEATDLTSLSAADTSPYIALSHPWGPGPHFCTFPDSHGSPNNAVQTTLSCHKQDGITFDSLPRTFQDAVTVTRALGKRYLWIDSLCILQGPNGDFKEEARRMETVFNEAYVVLAASWATNQHDGFLEHLGQNRDREVVTVTSPPTQRYQNYGAAVGGSTEVGSPSGNPPRGPPVYVCEMIDKFEDHVVKGYLNTRGWVLQERALARRTVYFTGRQTYWECGDGVRCETGSKMTNKLASFLGDPAFPSVALDANRGEEIRWYQDLYARYSRLNLSHDEDRPIAIRGLESRLVAAFAEKYASSTEPITGAYGVLADGERGGLLHRSLLWRRAAWAATTSTHRRRRHGNPGIPSSGGSGHPRQLALRPIRFPPRYEDTPPSWSWMAYTGAIDYINIKGDTVEWERLELYPISRSSRGFTTSKPVAIGSSYSGRTGHGSIPRRPRTSPCQETADSKPESEVGVDLHGSGDGMSAAKTIMAQAWEFKHEVPMAAVNAPSVPQKRGAGGISGSQFVGAFEEEDADSPSQIIYDTPGMSLVDSRSLRVVIVGREKIDAVPAVHVEGGSEALDSRGVEGADGNNDAAGMRLVKGRSQQIFVIVVMATLQTAGSSAMGKLRDLKFYKRIGVGWMNAECILDLEGSGEKIAMV